ncbi:MAG: hypothetical protein K2F84_08025, partial [Bacteroidales bacterium]|nr:hypothetical protein [Bacteroidales bacterium]
MKKSTYRTFWGIMLLSGALLLGLAAKREQKKQIYMAEHPLAILPAYADSIVLPPNIAPLGFTPADPGYPIASVRVGAVVYPETDTTAHEVGAVVFEPWPEKFEAEHLHQWHELLAAAKNGFIRVNITAYPDGRPDSLQAFPPLRWFIADEPIDPYLVYRTSIFEDASY